MRQETAGISGEAANPANALAAFAFQTRLALELLPMKTKTKDELIEFALWCVLPVPKAVLRSKQLGVARHLGDRLNRNGRQGPRSLAVNCTPGLVDTQLSRLTSLN